MKANQKFAYYPGFFNETSKVMSSILVDKERNATDLHSNTFSSDKEVPELQDLLQSLKGKESNFRGNKEKISEKDVQEENLEEFMEEPNKNDNKIPKFLADVGTTPMKRSVSFPCNLEIKIISNLEKRSHSLNLLQTFTDFSSKSAKPAKVSESSHKKDKKPDKNPRKTLKDSIVSSLFERKKLFARKIRDFETENSPENKKYYRNKNMEKLRAEMVSQREKESEKKKKLEEKKTKMKKYEKMKIKKIDNLEKEGNEEREVVDEWKEKMNEVRKRLKGTLDKISIKSFLWVKTIIKPHKAVFNVSVALLALFQYNVKFEPENWKKIQTFFISPSSLITQINNYEGLIQSGTITEASIFNSQTFLNGFETQVADLLDTKIYSDFLKILHEYLLNLYEFFELSKKLQLTSTENERTNVYVTSSNVIVHSNEDADGLKQLEIKTLESERKKKNASIHIPTEHSFSPKGEKANNLGRFYSPTAKFEVPQTEKKSSVIEKPKKDFLQRDIKSLKSEISRLIWEEERRVKNEQQKNERIAFMKEKEGDNKNEDHKSQLENKQKLVQERRMKEKEKIAKKPASKNAEKPEKIEHNERPKTPELLQKRPSETKKASKKHNIPEKKENELKIIKIEKEMAEKAKEIENIKERQEFENKFKIERMKQEKENLTRTLLNLKKLMKIKNDD